MPDLLTAEGLARFSAAATAHVADGPGPISDDKVPGLVALVARGDQVHVEARGSLSIGGPPVHRDSIFRITSMTKPVTAAATLALAGEGLLRLDEPVDRLLPELASRPVLRRTDGPLDDTVPVRRAITVRDLLTFTFGFGMALEMFTAPRPWPVVTAEEALHLNTIGPPNPAGQPDPGTWIAALGSLPLLAQPGERWLYNTGASVLGVLLARAAGEPFADVLRTRIFEPLGLHDTGFWTSQANRLVTAYQPGTDGLQVYDTPDGDWSRPPAFGDGAAGLVSTADDFLAFSRMLLRGGDPVLSADAVTEMTRDQLTPAQKAPGGLGQGFFDRHGWGFGQSVVTAGPDAGAFGWAGGFGTSWLADPVRELTVIVMAQRMFETPESPSVHRDLQAAAYSALA
jgi:CubicO group peptidase (beta-lactamase class C family)